MSVCSSSIIFCILKSDKLEFLRFHMEKHYVSLIQHAQSEMSIQNPFLLFLLESKKSIAIILSYFSSSSSSYPVLRICPVPRSSCALSDVLIQRNICSSQKTQQTGKSWSLPLEHGGRTSSKEFIIPHSFLSFSRLLIFFQEAMAMVPSVHRTVGKRLMICRGCTKAEVSAKVSTHLRGAPSGGPSSIPQQGPSRQSYL